MSEVRFAAAVCTYKRPRLLEKLLDDLALQETVPDVLIVVDGAPEDPEISRLLEDWAKRTQKQAVYQPSQHANLAYQRYLAWLNAARMSVEYLLYFDDDLRLRNSAIVRDMLGIMKTKTCAAGLTVSLKFTDSGKLSGHDVLSDQKKTKTPWTNSVFLKLFQSSRTASPGGLSAAGHRLPLRQIPGQMIYETQWLRGGVMFYRMSVLNESCYSDDLFALTARGCGLGEDTYLSRRAGRAGKLLLLESEGIEHPGEALPCAYPIRPFRFGFASAYSRRFLNDHYRGDRRPSFCDRLNLLKSYAGGALVFLTRLFAAPSLARLQGFLGYGAGAVLGLIVPPRSWLLAPRADWRGDAQRDLTRRKNLQSECLGGAE